ncbi:MAG: beta-lactamase family protein [Gammaproteobacteria bacterium]|nr:beta-lactamase family protein [Gammaproteobacteria bacterium]
MPILRSFHGDLYRSLLLCLLIGTACDVAAAASSPAGSIEPALQQRIDDTVRQIIARTGVPSASVALVREQRLIYARAYGYATLEPRRAALPSMRYPVGSISKEFTATALLLLAEQHRLSLDDPAGRFLDGLGPAAAVTIRQLLSHTSGVRDYWPQDYLLPEMLEPAAAALIIERWGSKPLDFSPGSSFQYSNTGYVIAGAVAEKVGGKPLFDDLSARVFRPLGMKSVLDVNARPLPAADATGYLRYALGPLRPSRPSAAGWLYAAGELAMTASDLARWDIALMQHKVLSEASLRQLTTEVVLANGAGTGYALGLDVALQHGRRTLSHGGEIDGFTSHHVLYPDDGVAVIVLTNQEAVDASDTIAGRLAEILLFGATPARATTLDRDRAVFVSLQHARLDTKLLTPNARFYFSAQAQQDFHDSLGPLGDPTEFELKRSGLRGGLLTREYEVTCSGRKLSVVVRASAEGSIEQYTVSAE